MSMGGGQEVKESQDERARAQIAAEQYQRWEEKFYPMENQLIADVKDSATERRQALGTTASQVTRAFGRARPQAEAGLTAGGARPGSSRFNLGLAGMGQDEGTTLGFGKVATGNMIDDQYYAGLQSLAAMGRGQQARAVAGLSSLADMSAQQALSDAQNSAANRAAYAQTIGKVAGGVAKHYSGGGGNDGFGEEDYIAKLPTFDYSLPRNISFGGGTSLPWN
ncbi:MAG: hypothetical protein ACREVL_06585 [Solimonas sp.]